MNTDTILGIVALIFVGFFALYKKATGNNSAPKKSSDYNPYDFSLPPLPSFSTIFNTGANSTESNASNAPSQVARWYDDTVKWAELRSLPWHIVLAQVWQESAGDAEAIGSAGEKGLMQLKQIAIDDARQNGFSVPSDWFTNGNANIGAGTAYLALQMKRTGDIREALKAYNQGYAGKDTHPVLAATYADGVLQKARQIGYSG